MNDEILTAADRSTGIVLRGHAGLEETGNRLPPVTAKATVLVSAI